MKKKNEQEERQKELKRSLSILTSLYSKARILWSVKKITSYRDLLMAVGYSYGELLYAYPTEQLDRKITLNDIKEEEINHKLREEIGYKVYETSINKQVLPYEWEGVKYSEHEEKQPNGKAFHQEQKEDVHAERLLTFPHVSLFKFQTRAAIRLIDNILIHKKRCQLLRAGVGTGKTYMVGACLAELKRLGFFNKKVLTSPWPILWITRASIVEQTKRVCKNNFDLDLLSEVTVLNIEQMRAKLGSFMVDSKTIVEGGEEHIIWKWREKLRPLVIVIDESQLAKNNDSTQSKIIQSLSLVEGEIYIICVSATPFTRVCEAKYYGCNTWKELK